MTDADSDEVLSVSCCYSICFFILFSQAHIPGHVRVIWMAVVTPKHFLLFLLVVHSYYLWIIIYHHGSLHVLLWELWVIHLSVVHIQLTVVKVLILHLHCACYPSQLGVKLRPLVVGVSRLLEHRHCEFIFLSLLIIRWGTAFMSGVAIFKYNFRLPPNLFLCY